MVRNVNVYSRMLVPLDGSKFSEKVFGNVVDLAVSLGMEIVLLSVLSPGYQFCAQCRNQQPMDHDT